MGNVDLQKIQTKLTQGKCVVLGDLMLDRYIDGSVKRISPEAPIPVVTVKERMTNPGGAANVAANVRAYGVETTLVGTLGADSAGEELRKVLSQEKILFGGIVTEERRTTCKTRIMGNHQQIVRYDEEDAYPLGQADADALLAEIQQACVGADLLLISDYSKGVCTDVLCKGAIALACEKSMKVVVDPKGTNWSKYAGAYLVTPNWKEFTELVGDVNPDDDAEIEQKSRAVMEQFALSNLLITRSERGMTLVTGEDYLTVPTQAREVADVSGAGDTVIATLAAFLTTNVSLQDAVYMANRAAGLAVERRGTAVIGIEDLLEQELRDVTVYRYEDKVVSMETLLERLERVKRWGYQVVFTNGCFDLLHVGHLQYLHEAKQLGDFLVVAVNTDASVKRQNKGADRPINPEYERTLQLAALEMVDAVVLFDEDTPYEILSRIQPDVLVKGGDYRVEDIVGREFAKETKVLSFKEGYSTTRMLQKIRESN